MGHLRKVFDEIVCDNHIHSLTRLRIPSARQHADTILRRAICSFFSSTLIYIDRPPTGAGLNRLVNRIIGLLCRPLEQDCVRSLEIGAID